MLRLYCALVLGALIAVAPATAEAADPCVDNDIQFLPAKEDLTAFSRTVVCLVNVERQKLGRRPLDVDSRLALAGERHANDMAVRDYFSHFTPLGADVVDRLRRVGYFSSEDTWMAGEVLAWGTGERATPEATVEAWFASPPHRAALLAPDFREIGAGVVAGNPTGDPRPAVTVVAELGRER